MNRKLHIRSIALLGLPALLVGAPGYSPFSSDAGQAGATKGVMIAGTSYGHDDAGHKKPIVRLRWSLVDGWLPAGGFNVYRDNDVKPLNSAPLIAQTGPLPEGGDTISGRKAPAEFHHIYAKALALAVNKAHHPEKEISPFTGHPHQRGASSEDVFKAMEQHHERVMELHQGLPRWHEQNTILQLRQSTKVAEYLSWLQEGPTVLPKDLKGTVSPKRAPPSEAEQVRQSRKGLIMAATVYPAVAAHLGLAFDDRNIAAGQKHSYRLRALVSDGKGGTTEKDVAECDITVGNDPHPEPPSPIVGYQSGDNRVYLRWGRPTPEGERELGSLSYHVMRFDKDHPQGISLAKTPIMVLDIPLKEPVRRGAQTITSVEPRWFVTDGGVKPGEVRYEVKTIDIFGRQSPAATLKLTIKDLRRPSIPEAAAAEHIIVRGKKGELDTAKSDATIIWTASDSQARYNIYRRNLDKPGEPTVLLTPSLIAGEPLATLDKGAAQLHQHIESVKSTWAKHDEDTKRLRKDGKATKEVHSAKSWLTYVDTNVPKEQRFEYLITATYPDNPGKYQSRPAHTNSVEVPDLTPLTKPVVKAEYVRATAPEAENAKVAEKEERAAERAKTHAAKMQAKAAEHAKTKPPEKQAKGAETAKASTKPKAARPADVAGRITLTWEAVPKAVKYQVYRANATGHFSKEKLAKVTDPALVDERVHKLPKHEFHFVHELHAEHLASADYVLLGNAMHDKSDHKRFHFVDYAPHSQAHTFAYRVVPVSRWGHPAPGRDAVEHGAFVAVHAPATLAPAAPALVKVIPGENKNVLQIRPNPVEEHVVRYRIYHRAFQPEAKHTPDGAQQAKGGKAPEAQPKADAKSSGHSPNVVSGPADPAGIAHLVRHESVLAALGRAHIKGKELTHEMIKTYENLGVLHPKADPKSGVVPGYTQIGAIEGKKDPKTGRVLFSPDKAGFLEFTDHKAAHRADNLYYVVAEGELLSHPSRVLAATSHHKTALKEPANVKGTAQVDGVQLGWEGEAKGYIVQRAFKAGDNFVQLGGIHHDKTYTDHAALAGHSYRYRVLAVDGDGHVLLPSAKAKYGAQVTVAVPE
jgi:fibronectin type 3 domain-containing protein